MDQPRTAPPSRLAAAALALAAALAVGSPAHGDNRPCRSVAARHLERLDIDPGNVKDISMIAIITQPEFGSIVEYQAWASFKSCPGTLVIKMTPWCRIKEEYTRGGCRFDNVRHF
ncbi:MAG: hypothetical protein ACE5GS_16000 [Kiloniellaceae bacterium]